MANVSIRGIYGGTTQETKNTISHFRRKGESSVLLLLLSYGTMAIEAMIGAGEEPP